MSKGIFSGRFIIALVTSLAVFAGSAYPQTTPFYKGKTITIIGGREPGGTGAMRVQALIPYLRKYIPGDPAVIVEYMPGGGGRKATNYIYASARPDGLTIGNVGAGLIANAILGEAGVQYDIDKLIYLGTPNSGVHYVFKTHAKLGLSNIEKLRAYSGLRIGAQTVGHDIYIAGRLFAWIVSLKDLKFVTGYSGLELDLALMRGEIDARANIADTVLHRNPEFVEKGLVHFHAIVEIPKGDHHPRFAHLPELETFVKSDAERKVLSMFRTFRLFGSPYILPPGTPKELVKILQEAMRKALKDPAFHKEFKKLTGDDPSPLMPEDQEKAVKELPRDPETVEIFKKVAGGGPLPVR
jgi:tripartite-type tricarboxylate transporter receptor subunit TctC